MATANPSDRAVVDWIERDILVAFYRLGVPLSLLYGLLAYITFPYPAMDLLTASAMVLAGGIAKAIALGRIPKFFVHVIPLLLLLVLGYAAMHEDGIESMVFTALPAFSLILRFVAGTWSATFFTVCLTAWGGILLAHPHWIATHPRVVVHPYDHGRFAILALTNLFVLWFAGVPARMIKKAFAELSRSNADLERIVEERTLALARSNRELESTNSGLDSFARSVSHDLRAPLRGILCYTRTVLEDEGARLSAESKAYLGFSIQAANRSNELIDGFLELARSSTQPLDKLDCDLARMVSNAIEAMRRQYPDRQVEYVGPASARAYGDRNLLQSVVDNLVSNAWKYTGKTEGARIEFAVEAQAEGPVFAFRDNGAGFEMAQVDRLFRSFSRLHKSEDFEGTGIGLSNALRILERHGGWIRGKGEPGRGAEFRFWLPPATTPPA